MVHLNIGLLRGIFIFFIHPFGRGLPNQYPENQQIEEIDDVKWFVRIRIIVMTHDLSIISWKCQNDHSKCEQAQREAWPNLSSGLPFESFAECRSYARSWRAFLLLCWIPRLRIQLFLLQHFWKKPFPFEIYDKLFGLDIINCIITRLTRGLEVISYLSFQSLTLILIDMFITRRPWEFV